MHDKTKFPLRLFIVYFVSYIAPAMSNTYLSLYLMQIGMSASQIGLIISVSTAVMLGGQLIWGVASDRVGNRNNILLVLFAGSALIATLTYFASGFLMVLISISLLLVFLSTSTPIQDTIALEILDGGKWNFGNVRVGGILGYSAAILLGGWLVADRYRIIFWVIAMFQAISFLLSLHLPKMGGGHQSGKKCSYRELLSNKPLIVVILFNLASSLGISLYSNFYPVYLAQIGSDSTLVGFVMFICTISELPIILIIGKLIDRIGTEKMMIIAGCAAIIRWFLLYAVAVPGWIVVINLLHGFSYTSFSYSTITFIKKQVPRELSATTQAFNVILCSVFSRLIFGYIGGLIAEASGIKYLMLLSGVVMAAATIVFSSWHCLRRTAGIAGI